MRASRLLPNRQWTVEIEIIASVGDTRGSNAGNQNRDRLFNSWCGYVWLIERRQFEVCDGVGLRRLDGEETWTARGTDVANQVGAK